MLTLCHGFKSPVYVTGGFFVLFETAYLLQVCYTQLINAYIIGR